MTDNDIKPIGNAGSQAANGEGTPTVLLPEQKSFFKIPARFGSVPVAEEPLGYDKDRRFEHHYPRIELPFQLVDVVETAAKKQHQKDELFPNGANRLFFGDCLHVMRMLPSECIDLIYIDPPFFSGRNYNIIFGDRNEVRSFSDIWEGGMPGYLIWLNARLYEMKRLLKPTGSIYVHLDWHASHYVKIELDKIFGYDNFLNEIVWYYSQGGKSRTQFARKHDVILWYSNSRECVFNADDVRLPFTPHKQSRTGANYGGRMGTDEDGRRFVEKWGTGKKKLYRYYLDEGKVPEDVWTDIQSIQAGATERIGYPTQKPEALLTRIIKASSSADDVVADFFCGGGTTVAVAQTLGRKWIGSDISRVAVAISADRISRLLAPNAQEIRRLASKPRNDPQNLLELVTEDVTLTSIGETRKRSVEKSHLVETGFTVEHWGIYEINRLTKLSLGEFQAFVLACYGARKWTGADANIHGVKGNELLWVAGAKETDVVTPSNVKAFAEAVMKSRKPEERQAVMIGWNIDPKARTYAEQVMALGEQKPIQFIKLRLWPLAGDEFKAHVTKKQDKYKDFFAFILPPDIPRIGVTRVSRLKYRFDVSEARSMNTGGKIVNVQWDFDFREGIFSATEGYQLCRKEKKGRGESGFEGEMTVEYTFEEIAPGNEVGIACRVQDDFGGEGLKVLTLKVE